MSCYKKLLSKLSIKKNTKDQLRNDLLSQLGKNYKDSKVLHQHSLSIIEGAIQSIDMQVREIMIDHSQMKRINISDDRTEILRTVVESGHSRFPVLNKEGNEVLGILLAKDLIALMLEENNPDILIKDIMRPVTKIPESKKLLVLLNEFREQRNHMALVYDEYGDIAGLVTIEDVLEEIVGEIEDEYDKANDGNIIETSTGVFMIHAITPIEDFNAYFSAKLSDKDFDTIGGLILNKCQRIPHRDENVDIDGFVFKVMQADRRRIHLLRLIIPG
jgi:magnesium and cobalt transporter